MISNFRDGYKKLTADKDVAIKIAGKAILKLRKNIFAIRISTNKTALWRF